MKRLLALLLFSALAACGTPQPRGPAHFGPLGASTFSTNLCLELQNPGENTNTWGTNLNNSLSVVDAYTTGILTLSVAGSGTTTLTVNCSTTPDQSRNAHFIFTGALTGNSTILFPASRAREFSVFNNTSGAFTLTICANNGSGSCAGTTQAVAQGQVHGYVSDGTNVNIRESAAAGGVQIGGDLGGTNSAPTVITTHLSSALPVNQGGTGATASGPTAAGNIGALAVSNNLSDVNSASTALTNLGAGNAATKSVTDNTKSSVASVSGSFTTGHLIVAADSSGTGKDGGAVPGITAPQLQKQVFTSTGTFTTPAGTTTSTVYKFTVTGSGGGGGASGSDNIGGGGGSGGTEIYFGSGVSSGASVTVTINNAGNVNFAGGTASIVFNATTVTANGGSAGQTGGGCNTQSNSGQGGGAGASVGTNGTIHIVGQRGGENSICGVATNGGASYWGGGFGAGGEPGSSGQKGVVVIEWVQ